MNKLTASLRVEINVECPHCERYLDLMDDTDAPGINEEQELWNIIDNRRYGPNNERPWQNINMQVTCGHCEKEFIFDELEY